MDNLRLFLESRIRKRPATVNADRAWQQLTVKIDELKKLDLVKIPEDDIIKTLQNVTGVKPKCVDSAVSICIEALLKVSLKCEAPYALLPSDSKQLCDAAVAALRHLDAVNLLPKPGLSKALLEKTVVFPLELIWQLHKAELLQISTYVYKMLQSSKEFALSEAVLWLLSHSQETPKNIQIVIDVFASLLVASQAGPLNIQLATHCATSIQKCVEDIVSWVLNLPSCSDLVHTNFTYLSSSELKCACGSEVVKRFVLAHLLHIINEESVPFTNHSLLHAVEIQGKTVLDTSTQPLHNLILAIVKALGGKEIVHQIGAAVVKHYVNWKIIFLLTGSLLMVHPEFCDEMKSLVDELIQLGLEGGRQNELSAGFLLARHCCTSDSKKFSTYSLWFSSHFGGDSVTARNTMQFQSLIKLLTDIVPSESADTLRVHLNKVPQAPTSCNSLLHDYCALARTRLADFNESSELAGLFSDSRHDSFSGLDHRQADIIRVLQHFQQTREINKAVLEASIFRRQYFRNVFLVELLGLPGSSSEAFVPENFSLDHDIKHEFILALRAIGKIPDKLFKSYNEERASQKLKESETAPLKHEDNDLVLCSNKDKTVEVRSESTSDVAKKKKSLKVKLKKQS